MSTNKRRQMTINPPPPQPPNDAVSMDTADSGDGPCSTQDRGESCTQSAIWNYTYYAYGIAYIICMYNSTCTFHMQNNVAYDFVVLL